MASLGQELKQAREARNISLHEIAEQTHISVRFLQAMENNEYKILPGGVFNRNFIRKFAKQVGYDEEQAIKLYDEQLAASGGEPQRRYEMGIEDFENRGSSGNGLLFSLLALILLAAGAFAAYIYFKPTIDPRPAVASTPAPLPTAEPTATPAPSPTPEPVPAGVLRVQVIADEECWLSVKADQNPTEQMALAAGDTRPFDITDRLLFNVIGNTRAVRIVVNGRQINFDKLLPNRKGVVAKNVVIAKDSYQQFLD